MTAWEQRANALLCRIKGLPAPTVVEIGFGVGNMAKVLLREAPTIQLSVVDNFLPAERQPAAYLATRDNFAARDASMVNAHRVLARNLAASHPKRMRLLEMSSEDASRQFKDGSVDLAFIDGDHSYEGVKRDIACWLPKVRAGGWIGGHDYMNHDPRFDFTGVDRAVQEFRLNFGVHVETDANFTWWARV